MKFPKEIKGLSEDAYLYGTLLKVDVDFLVKSIEESNNMAGFLEEFGCKDWYEWGKLYAGVAQDAWKYHDLMKANAQVVKDNIKITKEHQIVEGLKKRIEYLKDWKGVKFEGQDRVVEEFQKLLEEKGWTDKHTKIAKESAERFKTHTKDQEVDI